MKHARARDGHLRHHLGVGLEEPKVLQHRMVGKPDLAVDTDALRLGLDALELNAVSKLVDLDAVEHAEEIEMPPRATIFAVGPELEADPFLFGDDLRDFLVLDGLEL